jgi:uncharacterized protein (DUF1501 family)
MAAAMTSLSELKLRGVAPAAREPITKALAELYAEQGLLGTAGRDTLQLMERIENIAAAPNEDDREGPSTSYPNGGFGQGLRDIARLVKAKVGPEVACLDLGGWDTHFFQSSSGALSKRVDELAKGLAAFQEDLGSCRDHVVTVVMTEFGRRAYENTSLGTDHGRGSMMLILGDGIRGGQVHGKWPGLKDDALEGPGDLAVTTDYRSVLSEILTRVSGSAPKAPVFPDFSPRPIGLLG